MNKGTINEVGMYTAVVRPQKEGEDTVYEAVFKELGRSLTAHGDTPAQALSRLYRSGANLVESLKAEGESLPAAQPVEQWESYSGKITVRIPRSLHYKLRVLADEENVSLNSMAATILSWGAEHKHCEIRPLIATSLTHNNLILNVASPYRPETQALYPGQSPVKVGAYVNEIHRRLAQK